MRAWLRDATPTRARIDAALAVLDVRGATESLVELVDAANRYVERTRPWVLLRAGDRDAARAVLAPLVAAVRVLGAELEPFVPALASRVRDADRPRRRSGRSGVAAPGAHHALDM